jgi:hypothetical protein
MLFVQLRIAEARLAAIEARLEALEASAQGG